MGATGAKRFRLYRPPRVKFGQRLPLIVMLHSCGQDANSFASSTRMNRIPMRERFLVLSAPEGTHACKKKPQVRGSFHRPAGNRGPHGAARSPTGS